MGKVMNKAFKKYGKARWINTNLSRKHKGRLSIYSTRVMSLIMQSAQTLNIIKSAPGDRAKKIAAMADVKIRTNKAIAKLHQTIFSSAPASAE